MCSIICNTRRGYQVAISSNFARRTVERIHDRMRLLVYGIIIKGAGCRVGCLFVEIHIGKEIREELHRQERGASWLADKLHCDRTNVYNIFKRQGIDTRLLERISIILHRNFFSLYCQEDNDSVENDSTIL